MKVTENWHNSDIDVLNFNDTLTNAVVSFEHLGPGGLKVSVCFVIIIDLSLLWFDFS